jgi:hexosaminidase
MNFYFLKHRFLGEVSRFFDTTMAEKSSELFLWRGLHLDVARHAFEIAYLKKLIDINSLLGINIFHLHLSDDQGWRFECKKYPRLHEVGSKRRETVVGKKFSFFGSTYKGDGIPYEKYYTQEELKALVVYAKSKGITIVPEIDIPGHATALLVAYPEYSLGEPPLEVATEWGIFKNVIKDCQESRVFLKDIFREVMDVFDGPYIHLGGDEVSVSGYNKDTLLEEVALFIKESGRTPVFWNDALDVAEKVGGIVMAWESLEDMDKSLARGVRTVCSSSSHLYFDYYQKADISHEPLAIGGYTSYEKVKSLTLPKHPLLLGAQAQLWTEYIKTQEESDYMLFPRLFAFADIMRMSR